MTYSLPVDEPRSQPWDSTDPDSLLGTMTAALARGEVAEGALLLERALALNVHWEQLTSAVHAGIEQGYRQAPPESSAP